MRKFRYKPFNSEAVWKEIRSRKLKSFPDSEDNKPLIKWALSMVPKSSIASISHTCDYWGEWEEYKLTLSIKLTNGTTVVEQFAGIESDDPNGGFIIQAINRTPRYLARVIRKQMKVKLNVSGTSSVSDNELIGDYQKPSESDFDW